MAAVLLAERAKGPRSFWEPYLAMLSTIRVPGLARYEPYLQGDALSVVQRAWAEQDRDVEHLVAQGLDRVLARWALGVVSTRSFQSNFLPVADCFNHRHGVTS